MTSSARTSAPIRQPSDIQGMLSEIQAENESKVAAMTDSERQRELQELQETFSPGIMEMLAQRAQRRAQQAQAMSTQTDEVPRDVRHIPETSPVAEVDTDITPSSGRTAEPAGEDRTSGLNQALCKFGKQPL